jgi:chromosome segregation ATPase
MPCCPGNDLPAAGSMGASGGLEAPKRSDKFALPEESGRDGMSDRETAEGTEAVSRGERQAYEARIAELEQRRRSIDELTRFRLEAYKARLAELKQAEARHLADKARLERELAGLRRRHDALVRELARREPPKAHADAGKGDAT